MSLTDSQKQRFQQYFDVLKKADPAALAMELAAILVMVPLMPVEKILANIKERSSEYRKNKRITTRHNKINRLQSLLDKKRLSKSDRIEVAKLTKALNINLDEV